MPAATLLVGSLVGLAASLAYLGIGLRIPAPPSQSARAALAAFRAYWIGLAAYGALDAGWSLAVALGGTDLDVAVVVLQLKVLAGVLAFYGLVFYVGAIYTGSLVRVLVRGFYAALLVFVIYVYWWRAPLGVVAEPWSAALRYANDGAPYTTMVILLFVPPLLAAIAYASLVRHAADAPTRRRIVVVSASLAVFFGGTLAGWLVSGWLWWGLVEKLLALAAGLAVYVALSRPRGFGSRLPSASGRAP